MKTLKTWATAFLILWAFCQIYAQDHYAILSSGGDLGGTSYSIGQLFFEVIQAGDASITPGVQQAYEIFTVSIKETELNISVRLFPNPTTDVITIAISEYLENNLQYRLIDIHGKVLQTGQIVGEQSQLQLSGFPSSTYFLQIIDPIQKKLKSFRILKNQL
jgi:hypothetical protein